MLYPERFSEFRNLEKSFLFGLEAAMLGILNCIFVRCFSFTFWPMPLKNEYVFTD